MVGASYNRKSRSLPEKQRKFCVTNFENQRRASTYFISSHAKAVVRNYELCMPVNSMRKARPRIWQRVCQKGMADGIAKVAKNLLGSGFSKDDIAKNTGISM